MSLHKTVVIEKTVFDTEDFKVGTRVHAAHYMSYEFDPSGKLTFACDDIDSDGTIDFVSQDHMTIAFDCFGSGRNCLGVDIEQTTGEYPFWVINKISE